MSAVRTHATVFAGASGFLVLATVVQTSMGCGRREDGERMSRPAPEVATRSQSEATGAEGSVAVCFRSAASAQARRFVGLLKGETRGGAAVFASAVPLDRRGDRADQDPPTPDAVVSVDAIGSGDHETMNAEGRHVPVLITVGSRDERAQPATHISADPIGVGRRLGQRAAQVVPRDSTVVVLRSSEQPGASERVITDVLARARCFRLVRLLVAHPSEASLDAALNTGGAARRRQLGAVIAIGSTLAKAASTALSSEQAVWLISVPEDWNTPVWPQPRRRARHLSVRTHPDDAAVRAGRIVMQCLRGEEPPQNRIGVRATVIEGVEGP